MQRASSSLVVLSSAVNALTETPHLNKVLHVRIGHINPSVPVQLDNDFQRDVRLGPKKDRVAPAWQKLEGSPSLKVLCFFPGEPSRAFLAFKTV
jgi:hypothetical protein